jgi:anti-sigma regulatory factor (Ser/Thr protein kinase)
MMTVAEPGISGLWHAALFHRGAAEFEARVHRFAQAAMRAGAAMLITGPANSLDRLRARLDSLGDGVSWADMAEVGVNPGRLISAISRFTDRHPGRTIWCVQQATWASRSREELWEVFRHEALLNIALAGAPMRVLCPYDAGLPAELIACAEATHPVISPGGSWQPSPRYRGDARGAVPAECDRPLSPPPPGTQTLLYTDDLGSVRHAVSVFARTAGLAPRRAEDLVIAVGELTANTLTHAGGPGTLAIWTAGGELVCQVSDGGHITDPLSGTLLPPPGGGGDRGGRGLWLVHQLCDLVQVRTGPRGTVVRLHMRLSEFLRGTNSCGPTDGVRRRSRSRPRGTVHGAGTRRRGRRDQRRDAVCPARGADTKTAWAAGRRAVRAGVH